jgi:hypothetical protein
MLISIKLQFDSHRDIYGSISILSSQFMVPYILFILAWHSWTYFNIYLYTSSLIKSMQSGFPNLYLYKQTNIENISYSLYIVSIVISPLLDISSLMHSWFILQPWSKLVHYLALLVHAKQAIIETNPKPSTHVSFVICQICLLSYDAMISHNIGAISLIPFVLLSFA